MIEKIFLLRHGESTANRENVFGGWSDAPLTELGIAQAKAIRKRLGKEEIQFAYCSDLIRTRQTIQHANLRCEIEYSASLRERNYGELEGRPWSALKDPEKFHFDPFARPPKGETPEEVQARVVKYFEQKIAKDPNEKVLVVSHHGPLVLLAMHILGMPLEKWRTLALGNAGLSILSKEEGIWRIRLWNSLSALGLKTNRRMFQEKKS
jgi:broad specificity phosphatase PhoE